jgi:hypothetical protein
VRKLAGHDPSAIGRQRPKMGYLRSKVNSASQVFQDWTLSAAIVKVFSPTKSHNRVIRITVPAWTGE